MQGETAVLGLLIVKRDSFWGAQWQLEYQWKGVEEMQMVSPQWLMQRGWKAVTQAGVQLRLEVRSRFLPEAPGGWTVSDFGEFHASVG